MARFAGQLGPSAATDRMKCVRCGKWLPVMAAFCRRCGVRTGVPLPARPAIPVPAIASPPAIAAAALMRANRSEPAPAAYVDERGCPVLPYEPSQSGEPSAFVPRRIQTSSCKGGGWMLMLCIFLVGKGLLAIAHWSPSSPPTRSPVSRPPRVTVPAMPPSWQPRGVYAPPVNSPSNYPPGMSAPQNPYPPYPHRPGSYTQPPYGSPNYPTAAPGAPDGGPAGRLIPGTSYYIDSRGRVVNPAQPGAVAPGPTTPSASRGH